MKTQGRLASLDAFRGATIAAMILVNNPGSWADSYPQLKHAAWHGWTFTDMIFPFFLWIMGVAMTLSFAKRRGAGQDLSSMILHIVRRSLILFALGLFLNGFPFGVLSGTPFSFATLRIPGVLQRIALCYLVAGILMLTVRPRGLLFWSLGLLVLYWLALKTIPVPGYGAGTLGPQGNLCWFVDNSLLHGHTWIFAPAVGFDPEGIVSTAPAIATVLFGLLTGHWLASNRSPQEKTVRMLVVGYALLLTGTVLDMWLPINKNLWTTSYVVFMGGWSLICFGTFYWIIDVKGYTRFSTPLSVFGVNAIVLYAVSELLSTLLWEISFRDADGSVVTLHDRIYLATLSVVGNPALASLFFALLFVAVMFLLGWLMWRRRLFIKI